MTHRFQYFVAFVFILAAAMSRLLPHLPNFTPIAALGLFGGVYFDKKFATIVPLAALVISDYVIGFHSLIGWVYGSFLAISLMGMWLKNHKSAGTIAWSTLAGSVLFFIVTNFGVWVSGYYPHTVDGFIACYVAAIPFFRNTLAGDFFYVTVLFGSYELVRYFVMKQTASLQSVSHIE